MRPEISDKNIERLKEWAIQRSNMYIRVVKMGTRGGDSHLYTVDNALDELLKEAGF